MLANVFGSGKACQLMPNLKLSKVPAELQERQLMSPRYYADVNQSDQIPQIEFATFRFCHGRCFQIMACHRNWFSWAAEADCTVGGSDTFTEELVVSMW